MTTCRCVTAFRGIYCFCLQGKERSSARGKVGNIERFPIGRTRWRDELGGSRNGEDEGEIITVLREACVTVGDSRTEPHFPLHCVFYCRSDIRWATEIVQIHNEQCPETSCRILPLRPTPSSAPFSATLPAYVRHQVSHPYLTRSYINRPMYCSLYIHMHCSSSTGLISLFAQWHLHVQLYVTCATGGRYERDFPHTTRPAPGPS